VVTISAAVQPTRAAAVTLAKLARRAEAAGVNHQSVSCAVQRAEVLLRIGDLQQARAQAEQALGKADTLGLRELHARSEYVLAAAMRLSKDSNARQHYTAALAIIDEMKQENGNQSLLERADLRVIYAECMKWSKAS
jgi:hypothetical protein